MMVKLKGPGLGHGATGSLGDALIFSSSKGRPYVKKHARPKQPRTHGQMAMRAWMKFFSEQWAGIAAPLQDTWKERATRTNVSPFNAYQSFNLKQIADFKAPTMSWPPVPAGTQASFDNLHVFPGVRSCMIEVQVLQPRQGWGFDMYHVSGDLVYPVWSECIHVYDVLSIGWHAWTWSPLKSGSYWITWGRFTFNGLKHSPLNLWREVVIP